MLARLTQGPYRRCVDVLELISRLLFLRFPVGHAHLWLAADWLTLVEAGAADA